MSVIWSIAGSDPMSCAGIQQDIKAAKSLDVHCCTVVTTITAQNHKNCLSIRGVGPSSIREQMETLAKEVTPQAIKIGMIAGTEEIETICKMVAPMNVPVVYDPVLSTSSKQKAERWRNKKNERCTQRAREGKEMDPNETD